MSQKSPSSDYSDEEAQRRMDAALRGARIVGPAPAKSVTPKKPRAQTKKPKKAPTGDHMR